MKIIKHGKFGGIVNSPGFSTTIHHFNCTVCGCSFEMNGAEINSYSGDWSTSSGTVSMKNPKCPECGGPVVQTSCARYFNETAIKIEI